jgi:hypothetical protein
MRLRWRRSSSPEDRFETWIAQRHQERVFEGNAIPVGPCPDETFLRNLASKSNQIDLSDPRVDHAASCSICMRKLLALRRDDQFRRRKWVLATSVACGLLIAVAFVAVARHRGKAAPPANEAAAISQTVDLLNSGTFRGDQPSPLQSVSLPAALVKVTVILPRFSESGRYLVAVMRDQTGKDLISQGSAVATNNGDKEEVTVDLDLRNAHSGAYFLSTTHEQEKASYYYPLQIK